MVPFKKYLAFTAFMLFIIPVFVFGQEWSAVINIGDGNTPDFEIDRNTGYLHIVYVNKGKGVYYAKVNGNGKVLSKELIPNTSFDPGEWIFGPTIAVDMDGNPHVVYRKPLGDYRYHLYYIKKTGSSWSTPLKITNNVKRAYMVRMDIDQYNVVHIARSEALTVRSKYIWGPVTYYRIENGAIAKILTEFNPYRADNRFELDVTPEGTVHLVLGCPGLDGSAPDYEGIITYFQFNDQTITPQNKGIDIHSTQCWKRNAAPDVCADTAGNVHIIYGARADNEVSEKPSIRYVRCRNGKQVHQMPVTASNHLLTWGHKDYGLGSVTASYDGRYVGIAYLHKDGGDLYYTMSSDSGYTWSTRKKMASSVGGMEGRNVHLIRSNNNTFYLVYPQNGRPNRVKLLILKNIGDLPPHADAGNSYTGFEGKEISFNASESNDPGQNGGIVEYAWDWENDGVYDTTTADPVIKYAYPDDFDGQIKLRVTDKIGQTETDVVNVRIRNVLPVPDGGEDQVGNEGDTLQFHCQVEDFGQDTHTFSWDFGDGHTDVGQQVEHVFQDNRTYPVVVTVVDDDGGLGTDSVSVKINNLPPVAEAGGPYIGPILKPLIFQASATDPGLEDSHTYAWDLNWDGIYETEGQEVAYTYEKVIKYRIILQVTDDDGGVATDTADVTVTNYPPVIQSIPNQTIAEGESFSPIDLDEYVIDEDQSAEELEWVYSGSVDLLITLDSITNLMTIAVPDSEWAGEETIHLTVRDPGNQIDETDVIFTVTPVNDPPHWSAIPDTAFYEDDTLSIPLNFFRVRVTDIDDAPNQLKFSITGNSYLNWFIDLQRDALYLHAKTHWFGKEKIQFIVQDTASASDIDSSQITVYPVLDPPEPFTVIEPMYYYNLEWPDSIVMIWQKASDPDPGDYLYYQWAMRMQGGSDATLQTATIYSDTTYTFYPSANLKKGLYFWWVTAYDQNQYKRKSSSSGIVFIEDTTASTVVEGAGQQLPESYRLCQNYPNPFNPQTRLEYHLPESGHIRLAVYNTLGQEVSLLDEGNKNAGIHQVTWDGTDRWGQKLPSGIYLCRLVTSRHVFYRKMMLLQ